MSSLPKIKLPLFDLEVPSTKQKVKFRPFTVKEEKILLIAQEANDIQQVILSIKQIINNCVEGLDVDKLAIFDLEYLLISIRSKSVNNLFEFQITDPDTNEKIPVEVDVSELKLLIPEGHSNTISINKDTFLIMKYPTLDEVQLIAESAQNQANIFDVMISCIEKIVQDDSVYLVKDFSTEEINGFIDDLTSDMIAKIQTFFETMPTLRFEKNYINKNGDKKTFVVEGLQTFFI